MSSLDLHQLVEDIEALYSTRDPSKVQFLQHKLQEIQKSPDGYRVASELLMLQSPNCRFFGALTYAVVINLEGGNLSDDKVSSLLSDIQLALFNLIKENKHANSATIRKLLSNISSLFILHFKTLSSPLSALVSVLLSLNNHPSKEVNLQQQISLLPDEHIGLVLEFASILVEDISKRQETVSSDIHSIIYDNLFQEFSTLLNYFNHLYLHDSLHHRTSIQSIDAISSWITYISIAESNSTIRYNNVDLFVQTLFRTFDKVIFNAQLVELASHSMLCLVEILEINPRILNNTFKSALMGILFGENQWGTSFIQSFLSSSDFRDEFQDEISNFVNLLIVFLQADILKFAKNLLSPETAHIIRIGLEISRTEGIPCEDEFLSEQFLTFWDELANVFVDDTDVFDSLLDGRPELKLKFNEEKSRVFNEICLIYWSKIHLLEFQSSQEFTHYRQNVADLFITTYSMLNLPFYSSLAQGLINYMHEFQSDTSKEFDIESTLYLLFRITDDCSFYESQSNVLLPATSMIFANGLLGVFKSLALQGKDQVTSTLIRYLSSVQFFLATEEGKKYLGDVLDLLFSLIFKSSPSIQLFASKTVLQICQACRTNLVEFIPTLKGLLVQMTENEAMDHLIRQRLFNAYTSIAQCLKEPHLFAEILSDMIHLLNSRSRLLMSQEGSLNEDRLEYLISLLSCVLEIGRGCQLPKEADDLYTAYEQVSINEYWEKDPLRVKEGIVDTVKQFSVDFPLFTRNSLVTEQCCQILKLGLGEPLNGPFVFSCDALFQYISIKMNSSPDVNSVPFLYSLAETIIIVNFKELSDEVVTSLIVTIFSDKLDLLKRDPDLIKASIDFFGTLLEKRPSLLVHSRIFDAVVYFAIDGLYAQEAFIIKSVLRFWVNLITLKKGDKRDQDRVRDMFNSNEMWCQYLVLHLLKSFIACPRSRLLNYYPIFRQLISKFPMVFKALLVEALLKLDLNREKVGGTYLEGFVNRLMITRGQRVADEVLKQFWLTTNGLVDFNGRN